MKRNSKIMKKKMRDSMILPRKMSSERNLNNFRKHSSGTLVMDMMKYNKTSSQNVSSDKGVTSFKSKDVLMNFESGFSQGCIQLEDSINDQRTQFLENLKMKLYKQKLQSGSKVSSRKQSFIKRVNIDLDFNTHSPNRNNYKMEELKLVKKFDIAGPSHHKKNYSHGNLNHPINNAIIAGKLNSIVNPSGGIESKENKVSVPVLCLNNIIIPKRRNNIFKKNTKDIGDIVDSYLAKLHVSFYNKLVEGPFKMSLEIFDKGFQRKKEYFDEYVDQKIEVEMIIDDNPSKIFLIFSLKIR
jgi:hypothetical protein